MGGHWEGFGGPTPGSPGWPPVGLVPPHRVKQNSESERRSPSSEDDRDERESRAEIQNAEEYNEIFQPKNSISEACPLPPTQPGIPTCAWRQTVLYGDGVQVVVLPWLDSQLIRGP